MKEVIILTPGPFLKRDYERFGIKLLKQKYLLKVFDVTAWTNPNLWQEYSNTVFKCDEYISITSKRDFFNFNSKDTSKLVLDFLGKNKKTNWIRKQLKKQNSTFVKFNINLIPTEKINIIIFIKRVIILFKDPKKLINSFFNFLKNKFSVLLKEYNSDILVLGGTAGLKNNKTKNKIFAHSMDYDVYLSLKNKNKAESNPYAVFLEDNMTQDSDYSILNLTAPVNESQYFPILTQFLKKFEIETGLKVKFAIHPKSSKNFSNLLKDFEFVKGNTAEIVKNSSLVLLHASTSMSFAVLFNKPTVFLTSDELKKSWLGPRIDNLAQVVNSKLININSTSNEALKLNNLLKIDQEKYNDYMDKYIKMPDSPKVALWEIFMQNIKNNF
tara:strand:- start:14 stop:1165 length:1152 start_codon:yes stop_codon:yes gene_type:complete